MAFFNRKLYLNKPRQYGPASLVQSCILENAERAGIDPASIALVLPFWEQAGAPFLYAMQGFGVGGSDNSWGQGSYTFNGTASSYIDTERTVSIQNGLTLLVKMKRKNPTTTNSDKGILSNKTVGTWGTVTGFSCNANQSRATYQGFLFKVANSETYEAGYDYLADRKYHKVRFVWKPGIHQQIFCDGQEINYTANNVAASVTDAAQSLIIGSYYNFADLNTTVGTYDYLYFFNSALSLDVQERIEDNPFFLVRNNPPVVYSFPTASTVSFSPTSGEYTSGTEITLSCSDPTATIYYTTDGSDPDDTDTEYTTAVEVGNFTLKAIAYVGGVPDSEIASATYTVTAVAPTITTNTATSVNSRSAILQGSLTDLGSKASVSVYFEYGLTTAYGSTTDALALSATGNFSAKITDFDESTTYHFRAVASDGVTAYNGADQSITTTACPFELIGTPSLESIYWSWASQASPSGSYLYLDGVDDYLDTGIAGLLPVEATFSLMFWVKDPGKLESQVILMHESADSFNKRFGVNIDANGRVNFVRDYQTSRNYIYKTEAGAFPSDGSFHKVLIIKNTTEVIFYIDDVQYANVGDAAYNGTGVGDDSNFIIGLLPRLTNNNPFGIKGIKIWSRQISGSEITSTISDAMGANALLWYKFDEGAGATVTDYSGNDYHGTLYGNPAWLEE